MRFAIGLILLISVLAYGGLNAPLSVTIDSSTVTDTFEAACDSDTGYCLTGITTGGKLWTHFTGVNQSNSVVSVGMTSGASSPVPSNTTQNKTFVWAYGTATNDDVAVFNNLFVKLEGATTATGDIVLTVW